MSYHFIWIRQNNECLTEESNVCGVCVCICLYFPTAAILVMSANLSKVLSLKTKGKNFYHKHHKKTFLLLKNYSKDILCFERLNNESFRFYGHCLRSL